MNMPGSIPPPSDKQRQHRIENEKKLTGDGNSAVEKWREFLGPTATVAEAMRFMNQYIKDIIDQIKKDEAKSRETARHLKKVIEGKSPYEQ